MKAKVTFDYPTIEGMIYAGTIVKVSAEDFNSKHHSNWLLGFSILSYTTV